MIQIGSVHILTNKEFSKYEKLHRIFRVYSSSQELDESRCWWLNDQIKEVRFHEPL